MKLRSFQQQQQQKTQIGAFFEKILANKHYIRIQKNCVTSSLESRLKSATFCECATTATTTKYLLLMSISYEILMQFF